MGNDHWTRSRRGRQVTPIPLRLERATGDRTPLVSSSEKPAVTVLPRGCDCPTRDDDGDGGPQETRRSGVKEVGGSREEELRSSDVLKGSYPSVCTSRPRVVLRCLPPFLHFFLLVGRRGKDSCPPVRRSAGLVKGGDPGKHPVWARPLVIDDCRRGVPRGLPPVKFRSVRR